MQLIKKYKAKDNKLSFVGNISSYEESVGIKEDLIIESPLRNGGLKIKKKSDLKREPLEVSSGIITTKYTYDSSKCHYITETIIDLDY